MKLPAPQVIKIQRRNRGIPKADFIKAQKLKDAADMPPFFIRGQTAGSKEEYWVSLALDRLQEADGISWRYQVPIYGGRTVSGGLVIDFIVNVGATTFWVSPMGRYWHTGIHEDRFDEINAAQKAGAVLVAFFTDEIPTKEITYTFLKEKLGL